MRKVLLAACIFYSVTASCQFGGFYTGFQSLEHVQCPFDTNQFILTPQHWLVYQTLDGLWDGVPDSSRCISVEPEINNNGIAIPLDQIDPSTPLFMRFEANPVTTYPIGPNNTFSVIACLDQNPDPLLLVTGTDCAEGVCSGLFIGIAIPDSNGVPNAAIRYQTSLARAGNFFCAIASCFPSEKFDEQYIRQLIFKFSFPPGLDLSQKRLNLHNLDIEPSFFAAPITQVDAFPSHFNGVEYDVPASDVISPLGTAYLMLYTAPTYPSPEHQSYIEAVPVPNSSTPQTINLIVNPFETLEIQPFTNFRGGLVDGSDSVRHNANLVNMGGEFCLNFIDLIFSGGDEYRHGGGNITVNHPRSCMQFREDSKLRVLEGATLHYGHEGAGMLVVCAEAGIALERGATLVVDGTLSLSECNDNPLPQQIKLDLLPGTTLAFTQNAVLTNQFSQFRQTTLTVRMLGGVLDDSALSPEERALIHREYPAPSAVFDDNIQVFPNPCQEYLEVEYLAGEDETVHLKWLDLDGRTLQEESVDARKGPNNWHPVVPTQAGIFLLVLESNTGRTTRKVVKTSL